MSLRAEQRLEALTSVMRSVVSFAILLVAVLMILGDWAIGDRCLTAEAVLELAAGAAGAPSCIVDAGRTVDRTPG
jgi:hypothetical protein